MRNLKTRNVLNGHSGDDRVRTVDDILQAVFCMQMILFYCLVVYVVYKNGQYLC